MKLNNKGFSFFEILFVVAVLIAIITLGWTVIQNRNRTTIHSFEECAAAGNPIMESFPEQCAANGQTFVKQYPEDQLQTETSDEIKYVNTADVDPKLVEVIKTSYAKDDICQFDNPKDNYYVDLDKSITHYKANTAALVGIGCSGGAMHIFGYKNGVWIDAAATQMGFSCDVLRKYSVPKSFELNACFENDKEVQYP